MVSLTALIASSCTKIGLYVANMPASYAEPLQEIDIAYGLKERQKLDIYKPDSILKGQKAPLILFLYGGRWSEGDKSQYKFFADNFTKEGYIVALANYRHYPNVKFPAFAEDGAAAVAWLHNNAKDYGWDGKNLFVSGHSAGAHIGALVATDPQYLAAHNLQRDVITGFAGLAGPYAFVPEAEDLKDMFGPPERYPLMRAPNFVDGVQPAMLLMHGLADETVVLENALKLQDAIKDKGGYVQLITYEGINHVEMIGALMWFWRYKADVKSDMLTFFESRMNKKEEENNE